MVTVGKIRNELSSESGLVLSDADRPGWAYTQCMQTSMRVTRRNRDVLARIAAEDMGGVSMDEALRVVLFEHQSRAALARLARDPEAADSYLREAAQLAEVDVRVTE